ncbi:transposase [Bacillus rubiinfantis]|uniref:transposase n=1 Tax=Bacillus rubiinfantis TaxID=1499680 RepID=UPI0005AAB05A|nr:transposase [Bacillus rubiinfantis]
MVRQTRVFYQGAKFHVTSRGVRKSPLFFEEQDYEKYLSLLHETREKYPFTLYSYCLMTNHVHLQLETLEPPLSTIMRDLNTKYAKYFNHKYNFSGHVFEKRYGAELLNSVEYEVDVSKYIHLNPVAAGMVQTPEDYRWSSCRYYFSLETNSLVTPEPLLSYFPDPQSLHYQQYMQLPPNARLEWRQGKLYTCDEVKI